jgi:AbrB family looped-hinge helix DNA binding protein
MRVAIDASGRIVVPKALRDRLDLRGGEQLELDVRDGVLEIRPSPASVQVVETPEGPVAEALDEIPELTDAIVRDTLEQVRR